MLGLKVRRNIEPIPSMEKITTTQGMVSALMKLIEQDKKNRVTEGDKVAFAIAVSNRYLRGIDSAKNYELKWALCGEGCIVTHFKCRVLFWRQYKLIVPEEYWKEILDNSEYQQDVNSLEEALLKRLKRENIKITLVD